MRASRFLTRARAPMRGSGLALGLSAVVATGLAACGTSPPTRFYTLDPAPPAAPPAVSARVPPVRVDAVHVPPVFDRPELVRETAANEVRVDDFARWSAPLGETARRALTADLAARLPQGAVVFPEAPKPADGRGLVVDILSLSHTGGQAVLDVSWTLTAGRPGRRGGRRGRRGRLHRPQPAPDHPRRGPRRQRRRPRTQHPPGPTRRRHRRRPHLALRRGARGAAAGRGRGENRTVWGLLRFPGLSGGAGWFPCWAWGCGRCGGRTPPPDGGVSPVGRSGDWGWWAG